jgi:peptide chain release factor 1
MGSLNPKDLHVTVPDMPGIPSYIAKHAIRVEHVPTGNSVTCCEERSQHKNKQRAIETLEYMLKFSAL